MLLELRIENLAVMERASATFGPGLNAVTGETGAGKSVLLAALALALGGRSDPALVRAGSERALATAVFSDGMPLDLLTGLGVARDDVLVVSRELVGTGRSTARINAGVVPATAVRELGERLLEIHGQGSSSRWLRESEQRAGLDEYGGEPLCAVQEEVAASYDRRQALLTALGRLQGLRDVEEQELERAELDLDELGKAALRIGEDDELRTERIRLANSSRLRAAAEQLRHAVGGDSLGDAEVGQQLAQALQAARQVQGIDQELDDAAAQAQEIAVVLQELSLQMGSYLDHLPDDGARLAEVEERLAVLERLARRHGGSLAAAIRRRDEAAAMLGERGGLAAEVSALETELERLEKVLSTACSTLSSLRTEVAQGFQAAVTSDLRRMLMPHAIFSIRIWQRPSEEGVRGPDGARLECSRHGWDRIAFELAPNVGDQPRALGDSASGGEVARVALALLAHLSHRSGVGTVVFDEVDQGLGGEAANRVGELLLSVAERRQVICVTHLAPIAARAQTHLKVAKSEVGAVVCSQVSILDRDQRIEELARLLAGEATPLAARAHAAELLTSVGGGDPW
ncbi:MAG: DNA repair protein RecN [Candidatus Dormibacteria bacterium]